MSAQVIESQRLMSTQIGCPVAGSSPSVVPIGGVVDRWKCGAPCPWSSFFHGPRSGSPQVRA